MKKCARCKKEKNKSEFGKDKHSSDGLRHACKKCISLEQSKKKISNLDLATKQDRFIKFYISQKYSINDLIYIFSCSKEEIEKAIKYFQLDQDLTNKIRCPQCKKWKDKDTEFRIDRSNNTGRTCRCIECIEIHRNQSNIKEKNRKRNAEYYLENKNKIDRKNSEYYNNHVSEHSCRVRYNKLMRRKATPKWADYQKISEIYEEAERLTEETGIQHEVDHIIPLNNSKVCGLHVENNLQVLTKYENRQKWNKM